MIKTNLQRTNPDKQVLLIDFDQTIRNGGGINGRIMKVLYEIEEKRGMTIEMIEKIRKKTIKEGRYGTYNFILALCNNDYNQFNETCSEIFNQVDYSRVKKDMKLYKLLKKASKKYNIYIFTNGHRGHVDICCNILFGVGLNEIDFMKCFDITETYENGRFLRKQDENGLEKACERIGVQMSECILIDDQKYNIQVAQSKGMGGIHIKKNKLELQQVLKVLINIK